MHKNWHKDDVIQINPKYIIFGGCFLIVTICKSSGVLGFVKVSSVKITHIWLPWASGELIGKAKFVPDLNYEDEDRGVYNENKL